MGGTAILHRLFPQAQVTLRPHPEPMDLQTGIMALGTPEWLQLELLQKEILESLGLPSYRMDVLTSACMPDLQAQSDKMSALAFGVAHGFSCFNLFPLSASEVWSHAQVVLDVEYVHRAWKTHALSAGVRRAADALETTSLSVQEGGIVGAMADTVRHVRETYYGSPLHRVFSPAQWREAGRPDPLADADAYARELVANADYAPPEDKLRKLIEVYHRACREYGTEPMELD
jgi:trimethylamine:corrinoid methyltransferase-like protein